MDGPGREGAHALRVFEDTRCLEAAVSSTHHASRLHRAAGISGRSKPTVPSNHQPLFKATL